MKNIFWIYENEVAGRPGPVEAPWNLAELRAGGFGAILSVSSDLYPHTQVTNSGIERTCIPFPDVVPPDEITYSICLTSLPLTYDYIQLKLQEGKKVLVHCAGGNDRTGLVLSYYLLRREKISPQAAIDRFKMVRPHALTAIGWEKLARDILNAQQS